MSRVSRSVRTQSALHLRPKSGPVRSPAFRLPRWRAARPDWPSFFARDIDRMRRGVLHRRAGGSPAATPLVRRIPWQRQQQDPIVIVGTARTAIGGFQGAFAPLTAPQLGSAAIKAAVARAGLAGRRRERGADGLRAAGGAGPGAGAPGRAGRRAAAVGALHHRQQDVRLGHEDRDDGLRRLARQAPGHRGGRRHGEHDERALPAAQDARRRPARPCRGQGPHVPRRPGGCLRQGPPDGHLRRGHGAALPVHARGAGRLRDREPEALQAGQRGRLVCQGDRGRLGEGALRDDGGQARRAAVHGRSRARSPSSSRPSARAAR